MDSLISTFVGLFLVLPDPDILELHIGDAGEVDFSSPVPARMNTFVTITIFYLEPPEDPLDKPILDLIAHTPWEEVVYSRVSGEPVAMEDVYTQSPNIRGLHFEKTPLATAFPKSNFDEGQEIPPSLQYVLLDGVDVDDGDWSPLTAFLDWRASSGNPLHILVVISTYCFALPGLEGLVREFKRVPGTLGSIVL